MDSRKRVRTEPGRLELQKMTEERIARRLTTIFAADVVGFSRLSAADEEGTLRTLRTYRTLVDKLIARHDGRIFGTAGDSVIAEFPSAVEAVRCAMSVQEELRVRNSELPENRQMLFRIGINVGDVLVEGDNLFGDGVNIAARIESLAQPGGISISGSTFEQVNRKLSVHFEDTGRQAVKNIDEPIATFRVLTGPPIVEAGPHKRRTRDRRAGLSPLIAFAASASISLAVGAGAVLGWQYWHNGQLTADVSSDGATNTSALSVRQVSYGRNGKSYGLFRLTPENRWQDLHLNEKPVEYDEINRDSNTVYLLDRTRGIRIQLDLRREKIYQSDSKRPQRRAIYDILTVLP